MQFEQYGLLLLDPRSLLVRVAGLSGWRDFFVEVKGPGDAAEVEGTGVAGWSKKSGLRSAGENPHPGKILSNSSCDKGGLGSLGSHAGASVILVRIPIGRFSVLMGNEIVGSFLTVFPPFVPSSAVTELRVELGVGKG